ncbi:MAG: 3-oxoadipyl-CoA thiolase [Alphaproteobacteria bacterium]|nr:3-oxoadipyl-CoA thiolase [Alphaproteobacteria bacterium]
MLDAYIYDGKRTPFGRHAGSLAKVRPDDLLAGVIKSVVEGNPVKAEAIDDVYVGCGNQGGEDARCVARHALLLAGLPVSVPGMVFQRNCASGLSAITSAAQAITVGEADMIVAGGVESMSRAPFVVGKSEAAFGRDFKVFDSTIGDRFPNPKIHKQFGADSMPQTADNLASDYQITREQADTFALASQAKYKAAKADKFFDGEIMPVTYSAGRKGGDVTVGDDEHPRPETTMEQLAKLRALFEGGVTTAGNASGINDGAVAMIIGSRALGEKTGMKPIARILSSGSAGVAPRIMGYGPVPASEKALARAGLTHKDMDVIEINEAFASQVLACLKGMNVALDDSRVNMNGGAIALGHPLGASGPRIALTAARQLQRTGGKYGLVTLCVGIGQGAAMVIERCD